MNDNIESGSAGGVEIKKANPLANLFPMIVILACFGIALTVFYTIFSAPQYFENGETLKEEWDAYEEDFAKWEDANEEIIDVWEDEFKVWKGEFKTWDSAKRKWQRENPGWKEDFKDWEDAKAEADAALAKWTDESEQWDVDNQDLIEKWDEASGDPQPSFENSEDGEAKPAEFTDTKPGFSEKEPTMSIDEPKFSREKGKHWTENEPHNGNMFGTVYKGGVVIPFGFTLFLMIIAFSIERFITLTRAAGSSSIDVFVKRIRLLLADGNVDDAMVECDKNKGSVANVVKAGLKKYREVEGEDHMDKDQKKLAIQAELEEATNLELPMLEKNLPILATIVAIGVLVGLFGTVLGMIRAFSALATDGAPNASELATGISEALVNTAIGIMNSLFAIIMYNFFTGKIDALTYGIDEAGYSIVQTFDMRHKK